jgi:hypothetical protein
VPLANAVELPALPASPPSSLAAGPKPAMGQPPPPEVPLAQSAAQQGVAVQPAVSGEPPQEAEQRVP